MTNHPSERGALYFLAHSFRVQLAKELPKEKKQRTGSAYQLALRAKDLITELANISLEIAQIVVAPDQNENSLPDWFLIEVVRDLPRLAQKRG